MESILRIDVHLTEPKAIRSYTDAANLPGQLIELIQNSKDIFLDTFMRIVPFGDFHKKDKAAEIVRREVADSTLRRKMLQLLALIPEKRSLYLAQKAMDCRNIEKVMDTFAEINVSPVTISKRQDMKYLKCLYTCLISEK